jgi:hypothetical protein
MTREEAVCAAIVCDVLGATWERLEHSHDFNVHFDDSHMEHLEVSAFTDQDREGRWHQTPAAKASSQLTALWTLHVTEWSDLRKVQEAAEPHLATLEAHGRTSYFAGDHYSLLFQLEPDARPGHAPTHPLVAASWELANLGVEDAVALSGDAEGEIVVAQSVSTVGSPSQLVNEAVSWVAAKLDNIAKLTSARTKTHLFVPIRIPGGGVWSAVLRGPPPETPTIHLAIGRVWLLGRGGQVLYVDQGSPWQVAAFDPRVFVEPEAWRYRP